MAAFTLGNLQEEGKEYEYASYHNRAGSGHEEAHPEERLLFQPLGESANRMKPQAKSQWLTAAPSPDGMSASTAQSIAALVGMLLMAITGAILNWPWWLEYAVIAPFAAWLIISSRLVVYRQLDPNSASSDRRVPVLLVVPIAFSAAIQATRFSGLLVVAGFAVICGLSGRRGNADRAKLRCEKVFLECE